MPASARAALALLLVAAAGVHAAAPAPPKTTVYLGATLIDVTTRAARPHMAIVTRGERISAVMPADDFRPRKGEVIVDVRGKYIIPGLVNTHVHLATLADPPAARAYLRRELYSGVTTVRDMAGDARLLAELEREAELDEIPSPDIVFVALMAGPEFFADPRTHDAARGRVAGEVPWMQAITPQTNLETAVAAARGTGASAIKLYADLPAALVKSITEEAHRQHLQVWAHAEVFPARPSEVVDAGVDVISHACLLGYEVSNPPPLTYANRTPVNAALVRKSGAALDALYRSMKQHGTILDATLFPYDSDSHPTTCPAGMEDTLAKSAYRAGVPISTGTDDDFDWKDAYSALHLEFALLTERIGMTPADLLRSATLVGARAAGVERDAGSIETGKLANMVVLGKDPLSSAANLRSVIIVVKHGIQYPFAQYKPTTAASLKHAPR
jgi:imidazolonepropionase-like amidohydrolase